MRLSVKEQTDRIRNNSNFFISFIFLLVNGNGLNRPLPFFQISKLIRHHKISPKIFNHQPLLLTSFQNTIITLFPNIWLFGVLHKTRRPPRVCCSSGSVGGHIDCKDRTFFLHNKIFPNKDLITRKTFSAKNLFV